CKWSMSPAQSTEPRMPPPRGCRRRMTEPQEYRFRSPARSFLVTVRTASRAAVQLLMSRHPQPVGRTARSGELRGLRLRGGTGLPRGGDLKGRFDAGGDVRV